MEDLKQFIKNQGWSNYGIVSFEEVRENLKKHEKIFQEWVKKGYEADMDYLERMENDRFHPENKLPDVRSVIVLADSYCGSDVASAAADGSNCGVVARYARGKDYHKVLKKRLVELAEFLKLQNNEHRTSNTECRTYASVDSGPTVDRVLAESAGLGFFGKNCNIIDPSKGSYFFIASLMTNLDLEPTKKKRMPNCGDCMKCQNACPIGALVSPGVLDARKCISYLTIENKGGIPEELRPKIGNRLFGCDICQECCPFNSKNSTLKTRNSKSSASELKDILSIETDEEFLDRFAGTAIMRAKRVGLLRNACVVAGNSGDKSLIPYLEKVIERENDEMLRGHAEWGVKQLSISNSQFSNK
ncbi:tRNA epoxyqueuosine(34) reductase QueG [Patescibacteria group bacterium]|nr:tRNA epoxyqueuosine(34) reductase QueG [Patescibacteria group bacterium]MBU1683427.1 tRNA epoxyqueuosine(34) reductase QueG [Patescibacteria group bacterium]MBU1935696.1 tRNA epoxyqueuosine(34) reductase QueG [Patescibacteria group bacterium]